MTVARRTVPFALASSRKRAAHARAAARSLGTTITTPVDWITSSRTRDPGATAVVHRDARLTYGELDEAAKIDGATHTQIFFGMILRLTAPILAVIFLLSFIGLSSDFILASILLEKPEDKTLAVGLYGYIADKMNQEWTIFAAGAVLASLPIVGLFLYLQKYIVSGLTGGAVKG